jgi:hypothetical protein
MHVFNFTDKPDYIDLARRNVGQVNQGLFAGEAFAGWLLDHCFLNEVAGSDTESGDIVFYFDDSRFKHAGLVSRAGRVKSKWGTGYLYEHELYEVPESYGTEVRFFKPLKDEEALLHFLEFAEKSGEPSSLH